MEIVYALQAGPFVKIGTTRKSIEQRVAELCTGCPWPLHCIGYAQGGVDLERKLHAEFAAFRTHGEWFRLDPIHETVLARLPERWRFDG